MRISIIHVYYTCKWIRSDPNTKSLGARVSHSRNGREGVGEPGGCSSPVKVTKMETWAPSVGRRRPPNRRLVATRERQSAREGGARDARTEREREYTGGNWTGEQKQAAG